MGVALRHEHSGPTGQQLDRVREGRRHDGLAGRDGLGQDAGRDLLPRVVGQQDDVGVTDYPAQGVAGQVGTVEPDRPEVARESVIQVPPSSPPV